MPATTGATKSVLREEIVDGTSVSAERPNSAATEQSAGPPICALTLPQQIADHLGHRIMNGDYRPGSRLKEEELAEARKLIDTTN